MSKPVTCNFEIAYSSEAELDASASDVSCTAPKALKTKKISKRFEFDFTVGDSITERLNVKVTFWLIKKGRLPSFKMKTLKKTFTATPIDTGVASYPSTLSCPQENTLIYTDSNSFLKTKVDRWQDCAQVILASNWSILSNSCSHWPALC